MKNVFWLALAFFLAGMAIFGIYKSLDLSDKNAELGHSLVLLNTRIEEMRVATQEVQAQLEESGVVNEQLSSEIVHLKDNLADKEEKIGQYHTYALLLKKKMDDTGAVNKVLAEEDRQLRTLLTRVRLENQELRKKISSVQELKQAIRELKRQRQPVAERRQAARVPALPEPELVMGNRGYVIRDGVYTYFGRVDIQVRPAGEPVNPS